MTNEKLRSIIQKFKPTLQNDMYIKWTKKNGTVYYNVKAQEFCGRPNRYTYTHTASGRFYPFISVNVIDNVMEFAIIFVDSHRVKDGETREPTYIASQYSSYSHYSFPVTRLFITKDDTCVYNEFGEALTTIYRGATKKSAYKYIEDMACAFYGNREEIVRVISEFNGAPYYNIGEEKSEICCYNLANWLKSRIPNAKIDPHEKQKRDLFSLKISDFEPEEIEGGTAILHIEDVNDYSVVRVFKRSNWYNSEKTGVYYESERIFVPFDKKRPIKTYGKSYWRSANPFSELSFGRDITSNSLPISKIFGETKNDRINYIINEALDSVDIFVASLKFPVIEQLIKIHCSEVARLIIYDGTAKRSVEKMFGGNIMSKKITNSMNMNVPQIMSLNANIIIDRNKGWRNYSYYVNGVPFNRYLTELLGEKYKSCDEESSKSAMNIICKIAGMRRYHGRSSLLRSVVPQNIPDAKISNFLKRIEYLSKDAENIFELLADSVSVYGWNAPLTPLEFDYKHNFDARDVIAYHNRCVEHVNAYRAMGKLERVKNLDEELAATDKQRKYLNFDDGKYEIRLPKNCEEIVEEGESLHHCVGGYAERHAKGVTTILFLRDKENPDESLATIEVTDGNVRQIHLKYNAWLGTRPELVPTVMRWLRNTAVHCDDRILLCTATGYGANNAPLIEKPNID